MNEVATIERGSSALATSDSSDPVSFIAKLALDERIDEQKLRVLWDIQKDVLAEKRKEQAEAARVAYVSARAQMQKDLPIIGRDKENKHDKYHYATLENIWEHCLPVWTKYGFSVAFQSRSVEHDLIRVSLQLYHEDGHVEEFFAPDTPPDNKGRGGTINKTPIQANQSTVTYVKRGLLCSALGIVTRNEDDDGTSAGGQSETRYEARAQPRYGNGDTRSLTEQARAGEFNRKKPEAPVQEPQLSAPGNTWIGGIERRIHNAKNDPARIDEVKAAAAEAKSVDDLHAIASLSSVKKLGQTPDNRTLISAALGEGRKRLSEKPAQQDTPTSGGFVATVDDPDTGESLTSPFMDEVEWAESFLGYWEALPPQEAKAFMRYHAKTILVVRRKPEAKKLLERIRALEEKA